MLSSLPYVSNVETLPIVANWVPYLSIIKWTFEALSINELSGETFTCTSYPCISTGIPRNILFPNEPIPIIFFSFILKSTTFTMPCIFFCIAITTYFIDPTVGTQVLKQYSFDEPATTGFAVFGLSMLIIAYLIATYLFLVFKKITYITVGHEGSQYKKYMKQTVGPAGEP